MTSPILAGAEPWSHVGDNDHGAVVLHGFTGNPSSMRGVATALADNGLPHRDAVAAGSRHGRRRPVADPLGRLGRRGRGRLPATCASESRDVVVVGLSMGGALTLRLGADHPEIAGLVCINPVTQPQQPRDHRDAPWTARRRHGCAPGHRQRHRRPRRQGERLRRHSARRVAVDAARRRRTAQPRVRRRCGCRCC